MDELNYQDYKKFLKARLGRGEQQRLAHFLGCQPAFLSQVLRNKPHLSLEQGLQATEFFKLDKVESEYFMLALQLGRSGTLKLQGFFSERMKLLRDKHERIDTKIGNFEQLDENSKSVFYSSWKYATVQVLLSIPSSNQIEFIKLKTGLSEREALRTLEILKSIGLIEKKSGVWLPTKKRIHLKPEENQINSHHKNFRSLTIQNLEEDKQNSLHFSSCMALSKKDAERIKLILLEAISKSESILKPSPEETVRVFCMDYFEPGFIDN